MLPLPMGLGQLAQRERGNSWAVSVLFHYKWAGGWGYSLTRYAGKPHPNPPPAGGGGISAGCRAWVSRLTSVRCPYVFFGGASPSLRIFYIHLSAQGVCKWGCPCPAPPLYCGRNLIRVPSLSCQRMLSRRTTAGVSALVEAIFCWPMSSPLAPSSQCSQPS